MKRELHFPLRFAVLAAVAAAAFTACGDDDDAEPATTPGDSDSTTATVAGGNNGTATTASGADGTATTAGGAGETTTPDAATSTSTSDGASGTTSPTSPAASPAATSSPGGSSTDSVILVQEAIAIAQQEVDGDLRDIDADLDDGRIKYEIEIGTMEVTIDAHTGEVLEIDDDDDDDDDQHRQVTFPDDAMSPLEAIAIAEEQAGGQADDLDIDDVGGRPVFEVEIDDVEYSVDVVTGEVLEIDD